MWKHATDSSKCYGYYNHLISEKYVEKLFGVNKDRMAMDQMAVLLVSNVNESRGHSKLTSSISEYDMFVRFS